MATKTSWFRSAAALALAGQMLVAVPAQAADDTTTGLLAGLGLSAASGETKLGPKGGEIEGWMLASTSLDQVARKILERVETVKGPDAVKEADAAPVPYSQRTIILLADDEAFDLGMPSLLSGRIAMLLKRIKTYGHQCKTATGEGAIGVEMMAAMPPLTPADVFGAARTDTNFDGFDITLDERALINAIGQANATPGTNLPNKVRHDLRIPADATLVPTSGILEDWNDLQKAAVGLGVCPGRDDAVGTALKADLDALNDFATKQGDKGEPSPLERAGALGDLVKKGQTPLLLRVAVEKVGGTTIVRSNIFYRLGFPGAVLISGGIVVSYRLIDPAGGALVTGGIVRCALPQVKIDSVAAKVGSDKPDSANCAGDDRGAVK